MGTNSRCSGMDLHCSVCMCMYCSKTLTRRNTRKYIHYPLTELKLHTKDGNRLGNSNAVSLVRFRTVQHGAQGSPSSDSERNLVFRVYTKFLFNEFVPVVPLDLIGFCGCVQKVHRVTSLRSRCLPS